MPRLTPRKNPDRGCRRSSGRGRFNDAEAHASEEPAIRQLLPLIRIVASMMPRLTPRKNPEQARADVTRKESASMMPRLTPRKNPDRRYRRRRADRRFNDAEAHASEEPRSDLAAYLRAKAASMMPRLTPRKNPSSRPSPSRSKPPCFNDAEAHASEEPHGPGVS